MSRIPPEAPPTLRREKAALRARMREARAAIPPTERLQLSEVIEERLLALPEVQAADTVLSFSSFGSEVATDGIIRRLAEDGRRILLPFLRDGEMQAGEYDPGDELVATSYGPREPGKARAVDAGQVDVALVPGLAFDRQGYRVGYGGAYFDRFLPKLRDDSVRVGIAFHFQIVESVPHGPHDQPVDAVVTDQETFRCHRR